MRNQFKEIQPEQITENVFKLIGEDWMLITAGTLKSYNTMTASWGGLGTLWGKNVCFIFIRPTRYTYEFVEKVNSFTLSFFEEKYRNVLDFCGTKSGRNVDKAKETGITPLKCDCGVYFSESYLVIECKKIYYQDINPRFFLDKSINSNYTSRDYHRMYVGEITRVLKK